MSQAFRLTLPKNWAPHWEGRGGKRGRRERELFSFSLSCSNKLLEVNKHAMCQISGNSHFDSLSPRQAFLCLWDSWRKSVHPFLSGSFPTIPLFDHFSLNYWPAFLFSGPNVAQIISNSLVRCKGVGLCFSAIGAKCANSSSLSRTRLRST